MKSRFRLSAAAAAVSLAAIGAVGLAASPASAGEATCFGYKGNFNQYGATFVKWENGPDECFGVAPSGSIWHTWDGAGGWKEMPGNGKALRLAAWGDNPDGKIVDFVTSSGNHYCNTLWYSNNKWTGWKAC
ncbi:hypothetical protein [Streptomyces cavernae]|uniref:hypothetical protein n=1 Tax=Streptomyces cavernae TaxID=2259034 RepID=UPI000FEBF5B0|nr:hypothetical protein [Streptomyces cavernae]